MNVMLKRIFILFTFMIIINDISAQLGAPVYWESFGHGNTDPSSTGPGLPAWQSDFLYSANICPPAGQYTLAKNVKPGSCFSGEWVPLGSDAPRYTDNGLMMIINNNGSPANRIVYIDTVNKSMCPDITYFYSFAAINIDKPSDCPLGPDFPVLEWRIEDGTGAVIKKDTTRPWIPYTTPEFLWNGFGFNFNFPPGTNKFIVKITLLHSLALCAEDFAIDEIKISPLGPELHIAFDNEPATTLVKSVCFQDNQTVSMTGTLTPYYSSPALQWQRSTDNGATFTDINWSDVPGATGFTYSQTYSTPDTFLYRLAAAESYNISNPGCRMTSNVIELDVNGIPDYTVTNNSPICSGQPLKLNATGGASYVWTGPNGFSDNIQSPGIFFSSLGDSGTYYVDITTLGGCHAAGSTFVTILGTDVHASPDTAICKGKAVRLKASLGSKYEWTPSTGLSATNVSNPIAKPEVSAEYTVKVTDASGCSDTAKVRVIVLNKIAAKAIIQGTDHLCRVYDSASFKDISAGVIAKRQWEFGNGQSDTTVNPPVQYYTIPGNQTNYLARLIVTDTADCLDTAYHIIHVEDNCYIAVPTAFTPNGDGLNDQLGPLNAFKATNLLFRIYTRTGQVVFQTRDWTRKWDGTIRGIKQETGVYVWVLEYKDATHRPVFLKGTSVLIR
jgi:gliding motility-associated-like protein